MVMTFSAHILRQSSASKMAANLVDRLFTPLPRHRGYIDIRDLPEHLQRDLGFLDGRDLSRPIR
jgi:hypothetical protein